ncbi:MAG: sporulation protein YunB [Ruminococcus sp.]|nr:sporulation protein YunB [Ruminococcus sp.]
MILLFIAASVLWYRAEKAIGPVAAMQAEKYARRSSNEVISSVISEYLEETRYTYSDFSAVMCDEKGRVVSVEAVPYNINKVQSELTMRINRRLNEAMEGTVRIPLGTLTGKYLLAGKGPALKVKICPAEEAEVRLKSTFQSAGINQTNHSISAVITVGISSSMPMYSFVTEVSFEYLLAESVIVGEVPAVSRYAWNSL